MQITQHEAILDVLGAPLSDDAGTPILLVRHATLDGTAWSSDDASFALWLNSTFRATADREALSADLQSHGLVVLSDVAASAHEG